MAKFGTVEVYDEMARLLNDDSEWIENRGTKISYSMAFNYGDPVNRSFFVQFDQGKVTDVRELEGDSQTEADFVISGIGEVWNNVLTKQVDPTVALTRGQLKVKGKMANLLKNMNAFKYVIDKMTSIELT